MGHHFVYVPRCIQTCGGPWSRHPIFLNHCTPLAAFRSGVGTLGLSSGSCCLGLAAASGNKKGAKQKRKNEKGKFKKKNGAKKIEKGKNQRQKGK